MYSLFEPLTYTHFQSEEHSVRRHHETPNPSDFTSLSPCDLFRKLFRLFLTSKERGFKTRLLLPLFLLWGLPPFNTPWKKPTAPASHIIFFGA